MRPNLLTLSEKSFEEMCQALLHEEYPRFQALSAPDLGMDGYDSDSGTIFQCYFPEREPRKDKVAGDLEKAKLQGSACRGWILLLPKNPSAPFARWLKTDQQASCPFPVDVWGSTEISGLLGKHPRVKAPYFRSDMERLVKEVARGKVPRVGDALRGEEISAGEAAELREMVTAVAQEEAERRGRKPKDWDYKDVYRQFNSHYKLSAYDRLPRGMFADARYREILLELTAKGSLAVMDNDELRKVFRHFQQLQGEGEAGAAGTPI